MALNRVSQHAGGIRESLVRALTETPLLLGMLAGATAAYAQPAMPDAQVEANVLKALAGAPELADEAITTRTVYGTVTLSGSVQDEARRSKAEILAANADGVKKVIDELQLDQNATASHVSEVTMPVGLSGVQRKVDQTPGPLVLQSDGTYAPASTDDGQVVEGAPQTSGVAGPQTSQTSSASGSQADPQGGGNNPSTQAQPSGPTQGRDDGYERRPLGSQNAPGSPSTRYPDSGQNQPGYSPSYPQPNYPRPRYPRDGSLPNQSNNGPNYANQQPGGGQVAGLNVTIPDATLLRVRVNRTLASDRSQPGTVFDGIVVNDVAAGGAIAIPRGAAVQGRVVEAQSSGVLKGRGEMSIELTQVMLGGRTYPIHSDLWTHHGGDKTIETVNKTAGFGAAGAVIGALAGGGIGAAVGGGIGAAAGLGSSAASGNGQVVVPSESVITFRLAQEVAVATVSQEEMQRLAYGVAPGADPRLARRRVYGYPRVYVGPGYYPGYYPRYYPGPYGPYGYPAY